MRLLLLASLFALSACDRFADDPDAPAQPAAPSDVRTMYVKGAATLARGESGPFRSERVSDAVRVDWLAVSAGEVSTGEVEVTTREDTRFATVRGVAAGPVTVRAVARDAEGRVVATGSHTFTVTP